MNRIKNALMCLSILLAFSCSKKIGKIIYVSESNNFGLIEHCTEKSISKYDLSESPGFEVDDIVCFSVKERNGEWEVSKIKLEDRTHSTKWYHDDPFHTKTHIRPGITKSLIFRDRLYNLMEVQELDNNGNPVGQYEDTWIPNAYLNSRPASDFNDTVIHFTYKLRDQSGNEIEIDGYKLGIEVLSQHPPHN